MFTAYLPILIILAIPILIAYLRAKKVYEKHKALGSTNIAARALGTFVGIIAVIVIPLFIVLGLLISTMFSRGHPGGYDRERVPVDTLRIDSSKMDTTKNK